MPRFDLASTAIANENVATTATASFIPTTGITLTVLSASYYARGKVDGSKIQ